MKIRCLMIELMIIIGLLLTSTLMAKQNSSSVSSLPKAAEGQVTRTLSNISNWSYWMNYNGMSGIDPQGNSGGIYPRGTAGAIFQDGFIWGGKYPKDGGTKEIRVGGQTYNIGTTPGWIQSDGTPVSQSDPRVRIYRIRPDYKTLTHAMVVQEAAEANMVDASAVTENMTQAIIDQYATDWNEWPADLGAPFVDIDGDGVYNPEVDKAGIANADQVVWFVCHDFDRTNALGLYGSEPIGIELQVTAWAYNQPGARLGQIIFKKYKMINKSGKDIEEMYVAQWCDPDLGEASDDLLGCDTTLSMGYVYNGQDADNKYAAFGLAPAAVGYDFFQGPLVDGVAGQDINRNGIDDAADYGVFDLKVVGPGKVNLPMTGFSCFAAGSAISDPPLGEYEGTLCWWNMFRGYVPTENIDTPTPWTEGNVPVASGGKVTKFPMAGDPVTETGDLDAHNQFFQPGDRRMALCSGPFTFAAGDTQEVVVAVVGGLGNTRFSSITDMKMTDEIAQVLFDGAFQGVPKAPTGPKVTARALEDNVVLEWGSDVGAVAATEEPVIAGYSFEGYNIYQLPSPSATKEQATLLATFDLINGVKVIESNRFLSQYGQNVKVPIQRGTDSGIKRYFQVTKDYITGKPLYEGSTYYFGVTAYNYNPSPELIEDKALESALIAQAVTIQEELPGIKYTAKPGETIEYEHSAGGSDGVLEVKVIDPGAVTGNNYQVYFTEDTDTSSATYGETLWNVKNTTLNKVIVTGQEILADLGESDNQPIFDGLKVKVAGPPVGINTNIEGPFGATEGHMGYSITNNSKRWITWGANWGLETMGGSFGNGTTFFGSDVKPSDYVDVEIRFAGIDDWSVITDSSSENLMAISKAQHPDRWSKAVVYVRPTYAVGSQLADVPFTVWDVENNRQLKVAICEESRPEFGNNNFIWDMGWNGHEFVNASLGGREYVFILNDPYDEQYTDYLNGTLDGTYNGVLYAGGWTPRTNVPFFGCFDIKIFASNVILAGKDIFSFTAPVVEESIDLAKEDVKKINVFPNPYYAYNSQSTNQYDVYVTFTHLPAKATIRIFNLAGTQVRKLEKNDASQFFKWDLKNEGNLPVASGMYIAHIDMPDLKKEKVLKFMVIQDRQILEYY